MMTDIRTARALLAVAACLLLWLLSAGSTQAANPVQVNPIPPAKQEPGKPVTLSAKVVDTTNGRPVSGVEIIFFIETDVFGTRLMNVGKATTDATGLAALLYKPSWEGETKVVARFAGNSQYSAGEGSATFTAVGPNRVHQDADFGLEPVRAVLPFAVVALVLAVWGALVFTVVHTIRGIRFADPTYVPEAHIARRRNREAEETS